MKNYILLIYCLILILITHTSCKHKENNESINLEDTNTESINSGAIDAIASASDSTTNITTNNNSTITKANSNFMPPGFYVFEEAYGDLNKDGLEDKVLIIKNTKKEDIVEVENRGKLDRNRRGIVILFKTANGYEIASKNYQCFSSENEDGGVYYAPELSVFIKKGNLYIEYAHGRYGYWSFTFRYQNGDFEMIGYDASSNHGPRVDYITSINFSTKKKFTKTNTNEYAVGGDEVFVDKWETIQLNNLTRLTEINDFDELNYE
jgi:hypothetical protein